MTKGARGATVAGLVLVCCLPFLYWKLFCRGAATVLLVRHADRNADQDALNPAGTARAQELVHAAGKAGVQAIYQTEFVRTQQTAQPLAALLGLTPIQFAAADVNAVRDDILAHHRGQTVLVVGHSNTVPQIIAALGGPHLADIAEDEFDNLFVLTVCPCASIKGRRAVNLQYGALSP